MQTQVEFFQANAVDGELTDAQTMQMLTLPEGEIEFTDSKTGGEPSATPAPTSAPAAAASPAEPAAKGGDDDPAIANDKKVIAAKDGIHTIAYEKLVEARDSEKEAKARADAAEAEATRLRQELATKSATPPPPAPSPEPGAPAAPAKDDVDFGDFSDDAMRKGIEKLVEIRVKEATKDAVAAHLAPLEAKRQKAEVTEHFTAILTKHPDMDSLLESTEFKSWRDGRPSYEQAGIDAALTKGTATDVIGVFDSFKAAEKARSPSPPPPAPAPAADDPKEAARKAIAAAKDTPPSSLSELPGSTVVHDEANALAEMSPTALMTKLQGKTPEQIEALLNRAL